MYQCTVGELKNIILMLRRETGKYINSVRRQSWMFHARFHFTRHLSWFMESQFKETKTQIINKKPNK